MSLHSLGLGTSKVGEAKGFERTEQEFDEGTIALAFARDYKYRLIARVTVESTVDRAYNLRVPDLEGEQACSTVMVL